MTSPKPWNLELHVNFATAEKLYSVWARSADEGITQQAEFSLDLTEAVLARTVAWMESGQIDETAVQAFGSELFHCLFSGPIHDLYTRARQNSKGNLRIRLIVGDAQVARIPWELVFDPGQNAYLALDLLFIRDLASMTPRQPVGTPPPLRILVIRSSPNDWPPVPDLWEAQAFSPALAELQSQQEVQFYVVTPATLAQVQNVLREAVAASPATAFQVVHFLGHGFIAPDTGATSLVFADENGNGQIVEANDFVTILKDQQVKLLFLSACRSAQASGFDTAQGLASALMQAGIPMMVGMQTAVDSRVAQAFAAAFYAALVDGRAVDAALLDARRLIRADADLNRVALAIPVCYIHAEDSVLLLPAEPAVVQAVVLPVTSRRPWPTLTLFQKLVGAIVALIGLVASVVGIWQAFESWQAAQAPPPMDGSYNIAVASLASASMPPEKRSTIDRLATTVLAALEPNLALLRQADFDIQARGPELVASVLGVTAAETARAAEALALEHNADLLVAGNFQVQPGQTMLQPEFYLSPQRLQGATEVSGYSAWAPVVVDDDITKNPAAAAVFSRTLASQAVSWAEFGAGLGYLKLHRYVDAAEHFTKAVAATNSSGSTSDVENKTLYLLLGSTATKFADQSADAAASQQALIDARAYFEQALALDPNYARALLGLGQVDYMVGRGDCRPPDNSDAATMQGALARYGKARQSADPATLDKIPVKADLFEARLFVCWSTERNDRGLLEKANTRFQSILAEYKSRTLEADKQRIRPYAAEAYAGLGIVAFLGFEHDPTDREQLVHALENFRHGEAESQEADRKAIMLLWQARVLARQPACESATQAFDQAEAMAATYSRENYGWTDALYTGLVATTTKELRDLCQN